MERQKITNKEIAREIGRDIGESAKKSLKGLGKIAVKASYPVSNPIRHIPSQLNIFRDYYKKKSNKFSENILKCTYPILGNLSSDVQNYLGSKLGKRGYNPVEAFNCSIITNFFTYPALGIVATEYLHYNYQSGVSSYEEQLMTAGFALAGFYYAGIETLARKLDEPNNHICASLIGKLVSLPIEAGLYLTDKTKDYLKNVESRVQLKKSLENKLDNGEK